MEVDRRKISDRITRLKKELDSIKQHRDVMRKKRQKAKESVCSLVGYTNAGKTTLFNALTHSQEQTESALFTTLDTISRTFIVQHNLKVILSDTVGFIYKLPPYLVESFKATLEELHHADLLLHVVDASSQDISRLMQSVNSILEELELNEKPTLLVFNKTDLLDQDKLDEFKRSWPDAVFISASKGDNFTYLKEKMYEILFQDMAEVILKFPFNRMEVVNDIHKHCEVLKQNYQEDEVVYWVRLKRGKIDLLKKKGIEIKEI